MYAINITEKNSLPFTDTSHSSVKTFLISYVEGYDTSFNRSL